MHDEIAKLSVQEVNEVKNKLGIKVHNDLYRASDIVRGKTGNYAEIYRFFQKVNFTLFY
jgi:hypothetical protein